MPDTASPVPDFTKWPSFPFEGDLRVKQLDPPVGKEPSRKGEDAADCSACNAPDDAYIWVSERWRVRAMDRPTGLPMVLILESRSHLDLGDLPNLLAAELGVMTVRLERAVRSLDGVARVHVNRWGDGSAHLHMWFLARPFGRLQLRGTFLSLWDDILPPIPESTWRENLALVAAWLAEFGGKPLAAPPRIEWQAPSSLIQQAAAEAASLAQQTAAEDTSVALLEAPADESTAEDSTADESPAGRAATGAASAANAAAAGVVTTGGPTADRLTGGPAAQGAAATGATRPGLTPAPPPGRRNQERSPSRRSGSRLQRGCRRRGKPGTGKPARPHRTGCQVGRAVQRPGKQAGAPRRPKLTATQAIQRAPPHRRSVRGRFV
ncbi:hypothetical protein ACFQ1L_04420 [Phytohabitans flavus]|uniref:hypothetical protein n=1 Tax=Phytohabitans flavus TaxID=1076124 RepID=UPI0036277771